jgi:putative spermidine/putrescine transport system substrate-binding protein/spermidine/putrescine transport system substrate-binding protein
MERQFGRWLVPAALVALVVLACGGEKKQPATAALTPESTGTLTVLDWAGYEDTSMFIGFHHKYPKVTVSVAFGESDADIFGKMKSGADACTFHIYTGWQPFYVRDSLVQELDTTRLSHWAEVPARFKALGQVGGKQYFIPWDWGYTSILYRTDKVPGGIDSWTALFDPKFKGHISMWDDGPGAVTVATYVKGWDETKLSEPQLAEIEKMWTDQRKLNRFYWTGEPELVQGMAAGEIWVAYAWQGAYNTLLGQGVPVAYAQPKGGRNSWVGLYGIAPACKDKDLAYAFLDEKLSSEQGVGLISSFAYGHVNPAAYKSVTDTNIVKALALNDPTVLDRTRFTPIVSESDRDHFGQLWARVKAAR